MSLRAAVAALLPLLLVYGSALAQGYEGGYESGGYTGQAGYTVAGPTTIPEPVNLLVDSWQFESADWGGATPGVATFLNQGDPYGGTHATVFNNAGPVANHSENSTPVVLGSEASYTVSAWYRRVASVGAVAGYLRVYNTTRGNYAQSAYSISSTTDVLSNVSNSTGVSGSVTSGGSNWYRLAGTLTIASLGLGWQPGDSLEIRLVLWGSSTDTVTYLTVAAVQFNAGALTDYEEQP